MSTTKILDCTLRDGGFVNDWNFGLDTIRDIIYRLDCAGVDFIELGYLNQNRPDDPDRTILPSTASFARLSDRLRLRQARLVALTDYGTCDLDQIQPKSETALDGLRVAFRKPALDQALEYCAQLMAKGYLVFLQPVSATSYSEAELVDLVRRVNELKPYSMALVDSYGLMFKKDVLRFFTIIDKHLDKEVNIGYHAHNNFQMACASCMDLLSLRGNRNIILDSSIFGMGRGAGNALTEVLAAYLNAEYGQRYDLNQLAEIIDLHLARFYHNHPWGYCLPYYLSAANGCHHAYADYLLDRSTLSADSISQIIQAIDPEERLCFNRDLAEKLYLEHINVDIADTAAREELKKLIAGRPILLLATGSSLEEHGPRVEKFIRDQNPIVLAVNFIPRKYAADYVFFSNGKRYSQFTDVYFGLDCPRPQILATSNLMEAAIPVDLVFNRAQLAWSQNPKENNSLVLLGNLLGQLGVDEIYLAGFDGYDPGKPAYYYDDFLNNRKSSLAEADINQAVRDWLGAVKNMKVNFITPSIYDDLSRPE